MTFLKNLGIVIISVALGLAVAEAAIRYGAYNPAERAKGAKQLAADRNDIFLQSFLERDENLCGFTSTLQAHPYLGFVHKRAGICAERYSNNQGFPSNRDIPDEKDPRFFTILLVGGSVAAQLSMEGGGDAGGWLEQALNKKFRGPHGLPIRVLNGGFGGWVYPTQLVTTSLFGDSADAVVAIDGYNEAINVTNGTALEQVPPDTYAPLVYPPIPSSMLQSLNHLAALRARVYRTPVVADSFLVHYAFEAALKRLANWPSYRMASLEISGRFFELPAEWSAEKKINWNARKYAQYVRSLHALAQSHDLYFAHFFQPVREIGKELTEKEKSFKAFIRPAVYLRLNEERERLQKKGIPTFSLLNIFSQEKGEIYGDHIHCWHEGNISPGYEKMSAVMAEQLAKTWKLRERK